MNREDFENLHCRQTILFNDEIVHISSLEVTSSDIAYIKFKERIGVYQFSGIMHRLSFDKQNKLCE